MAFHGCSHSDCGFCCVFLFIREPYSANAGTTIQRILSSTEVLYLLHHKRQSKPIIGLIKGRVLIFSSLFCDYLVVQIQIHKIQTNTTTNSSDKFSITAVDGTQNQSGTNTSNTSQTNSGGTTSQNNIEYIAKYPKRANNILRRYWFE